MKLTIKKEILLDAINKVSKAISTKNLIPVLAGIKFELNKKKLVLTASDNDITIQTTIDCNNEDEVKVEEEGSIIIQGKYILDIVRKLPDNDVTIVTDEKQNTTITCEKAKFNIPGQSGEDFSYLPFIEKNEGVQISQFTLKELIRQTIFSIAVNENNKLMTGELFQIANNTLRVVSLDVHRISIRKIPLKNECSDKKVVVPGKTLNEISKILSGET